MVKNAARGQEYKVDKKLSLTKQASLAPEINRYLFHVNQIYTL